MKHVTIYSDGGCLGNPGPGGWAAILIHGESRREIAGACSATTNNRMELTAAIEALKVLKEPCEVDFHTDSTYVRDGMTRWLAAWKAKGWRRGKKPLMNAELWKSLDAEAQRHRVQWHWVRGHTGQPENERCDELANEAIQRLRLEMGETRLAAALAAFRPEPDGLFRNA